MENDNLKETFEEMQELQHNDLDDIVLEDFDKKEKIKKYLLIGGSILLIFIIVISIVKMISDSSSAPQDQLVEVQPQTSTQEATQDENFQEVPITNEGTSNTQTTSTAAANSSEVDQVIKEVIQQNKPAAAQTAPKTAAAPQSKSIKHAQAKVKEAPKAVQQAHNKTLHSPAKVHKVATTKKASHPKKSVHPAKKASSKTAAVAHGNYYIQAGAFLKYDPDKAFLKKIEKLGLHYVIKEYHINGKRIKRVYVGPFTSRSQALGALAKVRAHVAKGAFITKVR